MATRSGSLKTSCTPSTVQVECLILSRFEPSIHVHAIECCIARRQLCTLLLLVGGNHKCKKNFYCAYTIEIFSYAHNHQYAPV